MIISRKQELEAEDEDEDEDEQEDGIMIKRMLSIMSQKSIRPSLNPRICLTLATPEAAPSTPRSGASEISPISRCLPYDHPFLTRIEGLVLAWLIELLRAWTRL